MFDLGQAHRRLTLAYGPFTVAHRLVQPLPHSDEAWGELRRATDAAMLTLNNTRQALSPEQMAQRRELTLLAELAHGMLTQHDAAPR